MDSARDGDQRSLESPGIAGEAFRDDVRSLDPASSGTALRRRLPREELEPLTRLNPCHSVLAIAQTFGLLALTIVLAVAYWSWWSALIAVVVIAPLQHALFVLAHDAAHYRLFETRWLNDALGVSPGRFPASRCAPIA